jgi:archaellum biogenesis ATPase FlaH
MNTLIVSSLATGDVGMLFGFPRTLMSEREIEIVDWIIDYTSKYRHPPDINRLMAVFDTFVPTTTTAPIGDTYDRTLQRKRNHYARTYLSNIQEDLKKGIDPLPLIEKLYKDISGGDAGVTFYTKFDRTTYNRTRTAFPYEIAEIDKYTGGISAGDLVYLVGRLGIGKSTFAGWIIGKWLQRERRILMISNENRADDVIAKVDSFMGGWNPLKKRTMGWSSEDLVRISTVSYIASQMKGEMIVPNRPIRDVNEVQGLIHTYQPDIVLIDGIYLMADKSTASTWEKLTDVSRSLKAMADGAGVPIIGLTQASRQAVDRRIEIGHIAYSDALAQDADLVLTINKEDDRDLFVECIKNRWGSQNWGFFMRFFFETMTVRVFDPKHAVLEGEEDA